MEVLGKAVQVVTSLMADFLIAAITDEVALRVSESILPADVLGLDSSRRLLLLLLWNCA